jgi:hypothetical protein
MTSGNWEKAGNFFSAGNAMGAGLSGVWEGRRRGFFAIKFGNNLHLVIFATRFEKRGK